MAVEINLIEVKAADDPLLFICPFCKNREITFITNHTGQIQSKCNACQALGCATATKRHSKDLLKNVFKCLQKVEMINYKKDKKNEHL